MELMLTLFFADGKASIFNNNEQWTFFLTEKKELEKHVED